MANAGLTWTKERIERLKELWTEGLSASQIAAELGGGLTRNAVLGKATSAWSCSGRGQGSEHAAPTQATPAGPGPYGRAILAD